MAKGKVLLGYEIGTGNPVEIPMHHVVVTGVTQLSGKTTTLEALIHRSGLKALAFRTKRGERGFEAGRIHPPFFRERADWQYVQGLLEATMREKMKFERSWIIKACKGAHSLRDVQKNVERELSKAKGLSESVYTNLKAYLDIVLPEIERSFFTDKLVLSEGINVMDLAGLRDEVQGLVISSSLDAIYEADKNVVVVIPEAWKFCPEGRGNPVKRSAERLIRQGASIGIYLWFDSQDMAGVDKSLLKQVDNWILGRQREINEVEHTLDQVPVPKKQKPKADEIMQLSIGHFYACYDNEVRKVYVQPSWIGKELAIKVALGELTVGDLPLKPIFAEVEDDAMYKEELLDAKRELKAKEQELQKMKADLEMLKAQAQKPRPVPVIEQKGTISTPRYITPRIVRAKATDLDLNEIVETVIERIQAHPIILNLSKEMSEMNVAVDRPVVQAKDDTIRGRIAILISDGFLDQPKSAKEVAVEAEARGWGSWKTGGNNVGMYRELKWFAEHYFLRSQDGKWVLLPGVRERIREV